MELNWLLSKLQLLWENYRMRLANNRVLFTVTRLYERCVFIWIWFRLALLVTFRISRGLFVIFKMKRMNGRRRRARGRQYDSLRNSWPSPHCVVVFYTYLHLDSFIYCLFEIFSFLENRRVLSPLSLLPRSNSSLHLLLQRLHYTYHGICRLCHFLSISDTILLIFHLPDNTNFNHFVKFYTN